MFGFSRSAVVRRVAKSETKRELGRPGVSIAQHIEERRRARIAIPIQRMAEALDRFAPREPLANRRPDVSGPPNRLECGLDARARAAMPRPSERGQARDDDGVGIRAGRRDAARGEGGYVELVIGAQDQRAAQQIDTVRPHAPRAAERVLDRAAPWRRIAAAAVVSVLQDAPSACGPLRRAEGRTPADPRDEAPASADCARADETESRCANRGFDEARRLGIGGKRRIETPRPDQRGDLCDRPRSRQHDGVVAAVVEPLAVDERDRRLQDRHPPLKRAGCRLVRLPALFGTPPEAFDILS